MKIQGQRAIVTGASSGIGEAVAVALAQRGCSVVLAARRGAELERVAARCESAGAPVALPVVTDVRDREACSALVARATEELGGVDILVNNAGFAIYDPVAEADPGEAEAMMQTNYFGAFYCSQAVIPQMKARRHGAIINVASICGIMGFERMGSYCASKFALVGLTETLRSELARHRIVVSAVCPGTTDTPFFERSKRHQIPGASQLLLALPPSRVARAVVRAIEWERRRIVLPFTAAVYMKFKELFPAAAHALVRATSALIDRGRD